MFSGKTSRRPICGFRWHGVYGLEAYCTLDKGHQPENRHRGRIVDKEAFWHKAAEKFGQTVVDGWIKEHGQNYMLEQTRVELEGKPVEAEKS